MRLIDGIPESALLQEYAGKYALKFSPTNAQTYSPSVDAVITICILRWDLNEDTRISMHYTKSVHSIMITLKRKNDALGDTWNQLYESIIQLHNPNGIKESEKFINLLLRYYNKYCAILDSEVSIL